ncbi:gamma-glutamylcyclotransferase-like [Chiloscyllium plagiosum]|uniref:gamma-glutamylcyclotransferase-like n=1 Tax=Chiloscyllium plagiosum TaxID=36176 RepID=UPI001CB7D37E|nr:gamma-glutamylcyclotransferase-like [Chiloscyllium plagiosum]
MRTGTRTTRGHSPPPSSRDRDYIKRERPAHKRWSILMNRLLLLLWWCMIANRKPITAMTVPLNDTKQVQTPAGEGDSFCYFGYGSNLLRERLQLQTSSAVRLGVGYLKGYKLAFGFPDLQDSRWGGGVATIIPSPEDDVWGVIWRLEAADRPSLDDQEGVKIGLYSPIQVKIQQENTGEVLCQTYQMNNFNSTLPSPLYKKVICTGAKQNGLPAEYIKKLDAIKTNNYNETTPFTIQIKMILHHLQNDTSE